MTTPLEMAWGTSRPIRAILAAGKRPSNPAQLRTKGRRTILSFLRAFLVIGFDTETGADYWDHVMAKNEEQAKFIMSGIRMNNYTPVSALDASELSTVLKLLKDSKQADIEDSLEQISSDYLSEHPEPEEEGRVTPVPLDLDDFLEEAEE